MLYRHDILVHVYIYPHLKILEEIRYFVVLITSLGFIVQKSAKNKYKICVKLRMYFEQQKNQ